MILLGINAGFNNGDCSLLEERYLDLENGWIDYGRPKTGVHRRCPLWKATVKAIKAVKVNWSAPVAALSEAGAPRLEDANIVVPTTVGGLSTEPVLKPGLISVLHARVRPPTLAGEICVSVE